MKLTDNIQYGHWPYHNFFVFVVIVINILVTVVVIAILFFLSSYCVNSKIWGIFSLLLHSYTCTVYCIYLHSLLKAARNDMHHMWHRAIHKLEIFRKIWIQESTWTYNTADNDGVYKDFIGLNTILGWNKLSFWKELSGNVIILGWNQLSFWKELSGNVHVIILGWNKLSFWKELSDSVIILGKDWVWKELRVLSLLQLNFYYH